jgi:hypothetical protein
VTLSGGFFQVEILVGCFGLHAIGSSFLSKCLDWRRSIYSFNIDLGVDALGFLLTDNIISSTFGSWALDSLWLSRSPLGLNRKRLDFNLNFSGNFSPRSTYCLFLISFTFLVSSVGFRIHFKLSTKTVAITCSRSRVSFTRSSLSIGSPMFHQRHIACFRISHRHFSLRTSVQIRKAELKVV